MNNYKFLQIYEFDNKLRIGSKYDGGYIIIDNIKAGICSGISTS